MNTEIFYNYSLDRDSLIPFYFQVKKIFINIIDHGYLSPGEMIPTELDLCKIFNVSRSTIRKALQELVTDGYFYRVKGRGTFVSQYKIYHSFTNKKILLDDDLNNKGVIPSNKVLSLETLVANQSVSSALNISPASEVVFIKQVKYANNEPIIISSSYLPYPLCKYIYEHDLDKENLTSILSNNTSTKITHSKHHLEAIIPSKEDCELLSITKITALLLVNSIAYNKLDNPICYTISRYRGDKNYFNF